MQLENGYLKLSNHLAEVFSRANLAKYEWRILWVVLRKTYGWNKKQDRISITQFEVMAGLPRNNVCRTLKSLKEKKIIKCPKIGVYAFNKYFKDWVGVVSPQIVSPQGLSEQITGSLSTDNRVVSPQRHTKDTITKDTNTKDNNPPTPLASSGGVGTASQYVIESPEHWLVCLYKVLRGMEKDDIKWDNLNKRHYLSKAKQLLKYFDGDHKKAGKCMESIAKELIDKDLKWTFDTILRRCAEWAVEQAKEKDNEE